MKAWIRAPEIWLTPLVGLPGLVIYNQGHDFRIAGSSILMLLFGAMALIIAAIVQVYLRQRGLRLFARLILAVATGALILGIAYYYALYPAELPSDPESRGNVLALLSYQSQNFAFIGAAASLLSTLMAAGLARFLPRRKPTASSTADIFD